MKKVLICLLVFALTALTLTACGGKKTEAVLHVEELIAALEDAEDVPAALEAAKQAYNALSQEEKDSVKNKNKLDAAAEQVSAAVAKQAEYDEMNALIDAVISAAGSTFSKDGTDFSALIAEGNALLKQYDDMSADEKANVNVTDDFRNALKTLGETVEGTVAAAAEYVKAFNTLYKDEKYEVTGVYCIKQIRDETQYHIFALTCKGADGAEKSFYANARCSQNTKAETIVENAASFFAEAPASETYNAITGGNVTLELAEVLELAG